MLNPPTGTAVPQVPDSEISRFPGLARSLLRQGHSLNLTVGNDAGGLFYEEPEGHWTLTEGSDQVGYDARRGDANYGSLSTTNELHCHGSTADVAWRYSRRRSSMPTSICVAGGKFWHLLRSTSPREIKIVYFCFLSVTMTYLHLPLLRWKISVETLRSRMLCF